MEKSKETGHVHPLSQIIAEIATIFEKIGFEVASGPEVETEFYNFDALNIPVWHPARDMWDTFWLKPLADRKLLRTHTSNVQIHHMQENKPPIRIIVPGKVYRHEATDATHEAQFFQLEALMVEEDVSMAYLKGVLEQFFSELFKTNIKTRLRPSFFPFTEPSAEIDMTCFKCEGKGCNVCKKTGWIEIGGAGMVHPKVLENCGISPRKYRGFAFGMGIDRLLMLKTGIDDVRLSYQGDLRLVNQF